MLVFKNIIMIYMYLIFVLMLNLSAEERFSLKAHSAIVLHSLEYTESEVKKEAEKYMDFLLSGAGDYKVEDYSEDGKYDLFNEIYICKPISSVEHFYDPYDKEYVPIWNRCNPPYGKSNALNRAKYIYEIAVKNYLKEEKNKAYYYLGRVLHILADLSVPAHVHYTPHPFWPFDDRYERFHKELVVKSEYLEGIKKVYYDKFDDYFNNIAIETYRYPSDFEDGYHPDGNYYFNNKGKIDYTKNGFNYPLNNESIDFISKNLVKLSISYSSGFLEFFYNDVLRRKNEIN